MLWDITFSLGLFFEHQMETYHYIISIVGWLTQVAFRTSLTYTILSRSEKAIPNYLHRIESYETITNIEWNC